MIVLLSPMSAVGKYGEARLIANELTSFIYDRKNIGNYVPVPDVTNWNTALDCIF